MKSVVENVTETRVRLSVETPFEELKPHLDEAYREIAQQIVVPGFRKGKVPPRIIDQRVGRDAVLQEAVNHALPELYQAAVTEADVLPLGQPEVDVAEFGDGQDLKFTAEVDIMPAFELPAYQGVEVAVGEATATDDDVEQQLQALRERFGSLVTVERPAAEGDHVVIDLSAHANGEQIEDAQASGLSYQVGSGTMIDGLDGALVGLSAGDSATFETSLLGEHTGEQVQCDVTVISVKEQELPELDDEFAELASEFDTLDELRVDLRERVIRLKRLEQAVEARDKALAALLEQTEIPLPDKFIEAQVTDHFSGGEHGEEGHRDEVESRRSPVDQDAVHPRRDRQARGAAGRPGRADAVRHPARRPVARRPQHFRPAGRRSGQPADAARGGPPCQGARAGRRGCQGRRPERRGHPTRAPSGGRVAGRLGGRLRHRRGC